MLPARRCLNMRRGLLGNCNVKYRWKLLHEKISRISSTQMVALLVTDSSTPSPYTRSRVTVTTVNNLGTLRSFDARRIFPSEHMMSRFATVHGRMAFRQATKCGGLPDLGNSRNGRKCASTALSTVTTTATMFRYAATTTTCLLFRLCRLPCLFCLLR